MKRILVLFLVLVTLFSSLVIAQESCSISLTPSSTTSRATAGTIFTINSNIVASGSCSGEINLVSSSGEGNQFTVVDPAAGKYSGSISSQSYPFQVYAGQSGTYTYYITAASTTSSSAVIQIVDPSVLTVTGSPSTTSVSSAGSFTLSISIKNPASSAVTTSYSLVASSGLNLSGDPTSTNSTTIGAGSTLALQWTVSYTTFSGSKTIRLTVGSNTDMFTSTVTFQTGSVTTTTPSSGTGTGSGTQNVTTTTSERVPPGKNKTIVITPGGAIISIPEVAANHRSSVSIIGEITNVTDLTGVTEIQFVAKKDLKNLKLTVSKLDAKPTGIPNPRGKVHNYLEIKGENASEADLREVVILFRVEKSWITQNALDPALIKLARNTGGGWTELQTTKERDDANYYYYKAITPGFSTFAIIGLESVSTTTHPTRSTTTSGEEFPTPPPEEGKGFDWNIAILAIILIAILGGAYAYFMKPKHKR
ncbi:PGF-pre-PGF domain-containing protein [Candidatus Micrarchaeota archaeon]|nr:PGF-pre-PGF domain-containing protein [Candidatus Micrarchaeota archaeon]